MLAGEMRALLPLLREKTNEKKKKKKRVCVCQLHQRNRTPAAVTIHGVRSFHAARTTRSSEHHLRTHGEAIQPHFWPDGRKTKVHYSIKFNCLRTLEDSWKTRIVEMGYTHSEKRPEGRAGQPGRGTEEKKIVGPPEPHRQGRNG